MIEKRTLRPDELEAWYTHCHDVFQIDDRAYFQKHFTLDPDADCSLIFVVVVDGEIVSTVRVFDRTVWISGRAVRMGGIGEVSTKAAHRRQGYAGEMLGMAIDAMRDRHMPVSILFGDRPLYARMGWRFIPVHRTITPASALPDLTGDAVIRSYQQSDLPLLMGMYDFYAGRLDGAVIRSEAYWHTWIAGQWKEPAVLTLNDRPVAYCCAEKREKDAMLLVEELCAAPQGEAYLPGMLKALSKGLACDSVRFLTPLLPKIAGEDATNAHGMMVRVNDASCLGDVWGDDTAPFMPNAGMFGVDMF